MLRSMPLIEAEKQEKYFTQRPIFWLKPAHILFTCCKSVRVAAGFLKF